jgi:Flp pilus assembly protein TadG
MRITKRRLTGLREESDAIAIEFAFVLPVLIVLLLGIVQFGYAFWVQINMNNGAREAARELAVGTATVGTATVVGCAATSSGTAAEVACDSLLAVMGTYTLTACAPGTADTSLCPDATNDVAMRVTIQSSQIALGDIWGFFDSGTMVAEAVMRWGGS